MERRAAVLGPPIGHAPSPRAMSHPGHIPGNTGMEPLTVA